MDLRNEKLRKMIENDSERCKTSPREGSQRLFNEMIAKYSALIPDLRDSIPRGGKISFDGQAFDYRPELSAISTKLEMELFLSEPVSNADSDEDSAPQTNTELQSNKVFIVHGHNNALKAEAARLIESLGLEAIILHEQPSGGKTIIEKIEEYSDVSFAIVLYTFCDEGKAKNDSDDNLRPRARQNVVFEHGYMIAKLGRDKVCAIKESGVETPGDIDGVIYIDYDEYDSWKYKIVEELQKARFDVSKDIINKQY